MDLMPVSDQSEYEQHKGNQEQSGGFRSVHCMAMVPMRILLFGLGREHMRIVSPPITLRVTKSDCVSPQMHVDLTRMNARKNQRNPGESAEKKFPRC